LRSKGKTVGFHQHGECCQIVHFAHDGFLMRIGRNSGYEAVDGSDRGSIRKLFERVGSFDSLICPAGNRIKNVEGLQTGHTLRVGQSPLVMSEQAE
jgi:hypothetical protein